MDKKTILIVYRSYFPCESDAGPATAIRHLLDALGREYDIRLLTLNYDFTTGKQLFDEDHHVTTTELSTIEYVPRGIRGLRILYSRLRESHDVVEIHCGFDVNLAIPAIILSRLGLVNAKNIFHSPHGIFLPIDMTRGALKKKMYCALCDLVNLYKNVVHIASSPGEAADITRWHRRTQRIVELPHFVDARNPESTGREHRKLPHSLRICFVGRIGLQKNLLFAIDIVRRLDVESQMDVFGREDTGYYKQCLAELGKGTGKCEVNLHGHVRQEELLTLLPNYDVLFHPTLGENFGYSIIEALESGLPVLVSDQSPWLDIADFGAGWVIPLSQPSEFVNRLRQIHAFGDEEWSKLRNGALQYARQKFDNQRTANLRRTLYSNNTTSCSSRFLDFGR